MCRWVSTGLARSDSLKFGETRAASECGGSSCGVGRRHARTFCAADESAIRRRRELSGFGRRHDAGGHKASLKARGYSPICKTSADSMAMVEAALHPVILTTTAVVSSFGGMSPRNSPTAAKIVSTIARAD
jgi:hypothetical protein